MRSVNMVLIRKKHGRHMALKILIGPISKIISKTTEGI